MIKWLLFHIDSYLHYDYTCFREIMAWCFKSKRKIIPTDVQNTCDVCLIIVMHIQETTVILKTPWNISYTSSIHIYIFHAVWFLQNPHAYTVPNLIKICALNSPGSLCGICLLETACLPTPWKHNITFHGEMVTDSYYQKKLKIMSNDEPIQLTHHLHQNRVIKKDCTGKVTNRV